MVKQKGILITMRVITGIARGRKLKTLEGNDVRPTTDRVKESIFSIINFQVQGSAILDLFCGSGQLGIEALSRGADFASFVDNSKNSIEVTRENLLDTKLMGSARLNLMDCCEYLRSLKTTFDIVLMDPPYSMGHIEKVLPLLEGKVKEGGTVVCEHEERLVLPDEVGKLKKRKEYKYGHIWVTTYIYGDDFE